MPQGLRFIDPEVQLWTPVAFTARAAIRRAAAQQQLAADRTARSRARRSSRRRRRSTPSTPRNLDRFPELKTDPDQRRLHDHGQELSGRSGRGHAAARCICCGAACSSCSSSAASTSPTSCRCAPAPRVRELATRHALGASMQRLSRQMLTETIAAVASSAASLGIALGRWALSAAPLLGLRSAAARHARSRSTRGRSPSRSALVARGRSAGRAVPDPRAAARQPRADRARGGPLGHRVARRARRAPRCW